jgi:hypothetical protein
MAFAFNPLTGNFDLKGSGGGGGSAFFAGEVATYADLPLDGTAALNSRWLVRSASGVWPFPGYHQGGIYVRVSTAGVDRATDYLLADTNFPDVFSDAAFTVYDDADSTRSMQIEVTDNETLTFKVTGTDSVVRSVAFALSAIVLAALMASSALAQNIGLVTDTNGNVVTRRTNTLVWSNNLRFTPLTNANSRTAIIGTNGALTAGNPPSAAAANGALLTADGAGGSSFVASKVAFAAKPTNTSRSNWTNNTWPDSSQNQDPHLSVTLTAGKAHEVSWALTWADTGNVNYLVFGLPTTSGRRAHGVAINVGGSLSGIQQNATNQSYLTPGTVIAGANLAWVYWGKLYVPAGTSNTTVFIAWWPTNNTTNVSTLLSNSYLRAVQLD